MSPMRKAILNLFNSIHKARVPHGRVNYRPVRYPPSWIQDCPTIGVSTRIYRRKTILSDTAVLDLLSNTLKKSSSLETAVLHMMEQYNFNPYQLQDIISENGLAVDFSQVKFYQVAKILGLASVDHFYQPLMGINTFKLHRSRIPTSAFKSIVQDMDKLLMQYGPLNEHETDQATFQYLSPIFSHLIAKFGFAFKNMPGSILNDPSTFKGTMFHLNAFFCIPVVFLAKQCSYGTERLDAVAQVIAMCKACHRSNTWYRFPVPVYGILCKGSSFEFYLLGEKGLPFSIRYGTLPGEPHSGEEGLLVCQDETPQNFLQNLRKICEVIFDLLLCGYISSMKGYCIHSKQYPAKGGVKDDFDRWDRAIWHAEEAQMMFRAAETHHKNGLIDNANVTAEAACVSLKHSVDLLPNKYNRQFLMGSWVDDEVEKM